MAIKFLTLLGKNFRTYTRLEILIYLLLPLLMLHLVFLRCDQNNENPVHCFARRDGMLGDNVRLTPLYNSMETIKKEAPSKELLLYINLQSVATQLKSALKHILKIKKITQIKSEGDFERHLRDENFLAGIIWKADANKTAVTIRFPSSLRTKPTDLWNTDRLEVDDNIASSSYTNEGFLQILYAIIAFLNQPDLSKSGQNYRDKATIVSNPFFTDEKYKKERDRMLMDPIKIPREYFLPFYLGILYIYPFVRLVMHMQREKTKQQVDLMNLAGSNRFLHYLSWFFSTFIILTLINFLTIFILKAPFCENGNVLNCSSFTALLFFFEVWALSGICFCFLVYSLFGNVILAALVVAFFCILSFLLFAFLQEVFLVLKYIFCILFHYAFLTGLSRILYFEWFDNTGLQWSHIFHGDNTFSLPPNNDNIIYNFVDIIIIMLIVAFISLLLCLLIELCLPGRYGISRCRKSKSNRYSDHQSPAIVQTNMVRKWQKGKAPLKNFTMNMYDDQITVLLGLSDSGKSAAINSITGSIPPQSGWVKVDNRNIIERRRYSRPSLGLSPQHNALFKSLTVKQHMNFYSSLRNTPRKYRSQSINYLRVLDLWTVRDVKSRNLSLADQRKLSVACAFCGSPRIIVLDEPSEGLEPCERRLVWDLLLTEKRCRTIIVATYQIEEADALADRVAILCDGQLIFNGSSVFLKNSYGSGYQLVCSQGEIFPEQQITSLVSKYIPDTNASCDRPCEIAFNIPQESCCGIAPLLKELELSERCGDMESIQIGTTPVVEKFLNAASAGCDKLSKCNNFCNLPEPDECLLKGQKLCCNQWKAMMLKKFYHIKHNALLFFGLPLLLLMGFAALLAYFSKSPDLMKYHYVGNKHFASQKSLKLDLDSYGEDCSYAFVENESPEHPLVSVLKNKIKLCSADVISQNDLNNNQDLLNDKYVLALKMSKCNYEIFYSRKFLHSEAMAAALMGYLANNNLLDRYCSGYNKETILPERNIEFYNHPYRSIQYSRNSKMYDIECSKSGKLYVLLACLSIFTGFFAAYIIRERIIGYKLMQQVEGINMATFWLSHLLLEWMWLSLFSTLLVVLMTLILGESLNNEIFAYIIALNFFNLAQLPFLYLLLQLFNCKIFGWIIPILLLMLLAIPFELDAPDIPFGILYLIPIYTAIALLHAICLQAEKHRLCGIYISSMNDFCQHSHLSAIWVGIIYVAILSFLALFYFILLMLYEKGFPCKKKKSYDFPEDANRMTRNEVRNHTLLLENVRSKRSRRSIKDVTFGLRPMDVLGLVGERSGKTTINKMIISESDISRGRITVRGIEVHEKKKSKYRSFKYLGYCPQRDCFEPNFTGRENLKVFCLIRGIRSGKVRDVSEELAENLNFKENLNKKSKLYTVSDKRKLSTAIAVIGTPPLIILDEPTAGIEKAHRSDVLEVLKSVNNCGCSILLSSNNIEDFQTLCNRLALIKRGKLIAIGSVESYKNLSTRGLILMVKARPQAIVGELGYGQAQINNHAIINVISRFLLTNFGSVYLLEEIQGDMLFYIHNTTIPLAKAFQIIEKNRHQLYISDFYLKHENMELSFVTQNFRILR